MPARSSSFVRRVVSLCGFALLTIVGLYACGRSNLDDYLLGGDGGTSPVEGGTDAHDSGPVADVIVPDNAACNATTCPGGCCDSNGHCAAGSSVTSCGTLGESCQSCAAEGFQVCDPTRHACGNPVASCSPESCGGCCEGNVCFAGSDPNECGRAGEGCLHCASSSLTCAGQTCVTSACGPSNCAGCCFGDQCISGLDETACGAGGAVCGNCLAEEGKCVPGATGGVCIGQVACNASNCAGCCQGNQCQPGFEPDACGFEGSACVDCEATGGDCLAIEQGGVCEGQTGCGPENCPGCCLGDECLSGVDPNDCGGGGETCQDCFDEGGQCVPEGGFGGFCSEQICNPQNCPGCCSEEGTCVPGFDPTACGAGGSTCVDCTEFGGSCSGGDGGVTQCIAAPPPVCNAQTCPFGCCDGTSCLPGDLDSFCGIGGASCANCTTSGTGCKGQACGGLPPKCNASNCQGCCDASGACQAGFIDTVCGQSGASCEDCTQIIPSTTCDVSVTPRTCVSQQSQCPGPYPSCDGSLETPSPTQQSACGSSDLQNAAAACEGGAHSTACASFFAFEKSSNAACATCLTAFDFDFSELTGLTTCAAPFVDPSCNHTTACLVDCTDKACAQCVDPGALTQCQGEVPNGVCEVFYDGAQCIESAFFGQGSFCDPSQGTGQFGDWLSQVGQFYCGQ